MYLPIGLSTATHPRSCLRDDWKGSFCANMMAASCATAGMDSSLAAASLMCFSSSLASRITKEIGSMSSATSCPECPARSGGIIQDTSSLFFGSPRRWKRAGLTCISAVRRGSGEISAGALAPLSWRSSESNPGLRVIALRLTG